MSVPRGIRNANPMNLRKGNPDWVGLAPIQSDPDFLVFRDPVWGLRAGMRVLLTYYTKYSLDTVRALINRFAPPSENDTGSYQNAVAREAGVGVDDPVNLPNPIIMARIAKAIVRHENGTPPDDRPPAWFSDAIYAEAANLALGISQSARI